MAVVAHSAMGPGLPPEGASIFLGISMTIEMTLYGARRSLGFEMTHLFEPAVPKLVPFSVIGCDFLAKRNDDARRRRGIRLVLVVAIRNDLEELRQIEEERIAPRTDENLDAALSASSVC